MSEPKRAYRISPFPDYDTEGVESWLTELAQEGLLLEKEKPILHFFSFLKTTPQTVRYRLEPVGKTQGIFDADPGEPKSEIIQLCQELGWEYITRYGEFLIFRSSDPHARELHTDAQVQLMNLNTLKKRRRDSFFASLIALGLYALWGVFGYPMGIAAALGTPAMICLYLYITWKFASPLVYLIRVGHLQKQLRAGKSLHEKRDWRKGLVLRRIVRVLPSVMVAVVCVSFFCVKLDPHREARPLEEFPGDPPFATIGDLFPLGSQQFEEMFYATNEFSAWQDLLFPTVIEWDELSKLDLPEGVVSASLDVQYIEAIHPVVARQMGLELIRFDSKQFFPLRADVETTTSDNVTIYQYVGKYRIQSALLLCGNIAVHAKFTIDNTEDSRVKTLWIEKMAEILNQQYKEESLS